VIKQWNVVNAIKRKYSIQSSYVFTCLDLNGVCLLFLFETAILKKSKTKEKK